MQPICVNVLNLRSPKFLRSHLARIGVHFVYFVVVCAVLVGAIAPANAANPDHVAQVLETRACPGCDLGAADLRGANLQGSNLEGANLEGAYLMATNLTKANLKQANLNSARLYAATLTDADLTGAKTDSILLNSATICHTRTPSGKVSNRDCDR